MLMWHLGSVVNVTKDNGSGHGTRRALIMTVITISLAFFKLSQSKYNQCLTNTYTMVELASDAELIDGNKE